MFSYERQADLLVIYLDGDVDHAKVTNMRARLDKMLSDKAVRRLVFDLKEVSFMDSSGVGFIIGRYKLMRARRGRVAVKNVSGYTDRILKMSGLYEIIEKLA